MTPEQREVHAYLAPGRSFWNWSDDGRVIAWAGGKTLAFTEEIRALVTRLATTGLPPLAAILLFRAACRDDWPAVRTGHFNFYSYFTPEMGDPPLPLFPAGMPLPHTVLHDALARLDTLANLDPAARKSLPALCDLAEIFFEGCRQTAAPELAQAIAVQFANGILPDLLAQFAPENWFAADLAPLHAIATGAGVFSESALTLRRKTGLDAPVEAADIPIPKAARALIAALAGDPELSGLARVAHDLLAAISVPRTLRPTEELPLGGFSDISNRGTLDRLLVSELAHDDLTLAVRIATNEAMYMRRETPPAHPPERRAILIDAGIRMWGIPRVFAAAAALAFAANAKAKAAIVAHRPVRAALEPVNLATRVGLLEHLAALDTAAHPAAALPAFFKSLETNAADTRTEAVIITHEDVLADSEFYCALKADDQTQLLIATVARDGLNGCFRIYQVTRTGRRLLSEARVPIGDLLHEAPAERPIVTESPRDLPVILTLPLLPLLLPHSFSAERAAAAPAHGLLMATYNGRLLQWQRDGRYARELAHDLPGGRLLGLYLTDESACVVVHTQDNRVLATAVDFISGRSRGMCFAAREDKPIGAGLFSNTLFVVYPRIIDALSPSTGEPMTVGRPADQHWVSNHYFAERQSILTLALDGRTMRYLKAGPRHVGDATVIHVFERQSVEGPHRVMNDGQILVDQFNPEPTSVTVAAPFPYPEKFPCRIIAVSRDGSRLAAAVNNNLLQVHLNRDLIAAPWRPATGKDLNEIRFGLSAAWPADRAMRKIFSSVAVADDGAISLYKPMGTPATISLRGDRLVLAEQTAGQVQRSAPRAGFEACPALSRSFNLKVVRTRFGKIFVDSRGLLHLVPADPAKPQITLTLMYGEIAAWTSHGLTSGPEAFHPGAPVSTGGEIAQLLRDFATHFPNDRSRR